MFSSGLRHLLQGASIIRFIYATISKPNHHYSLFFWDFVKSSELNLNRPETIFSSRPSSDPSSVRHNHIFHKTINGLPLKPRRQFKRYFIRNIIGILQCNNTLKKFILLLLNDVSALLSRDPIYTI